MKATSKLEFEQLQRAIAALPRHCSDFQTADVPKNGIYFFFEQGEAIESEGRETDRIVRVGTHRRDGNLPIRLKNHFRGNVRGSVFRRHCRSAFCERKMLDDYQIAQIAAAPGARIPEVEAALSAYFAAHFTFACIPINGRVNRLRLESGLISLVANYPIRAPSETWLGRYASREEIQSSGLWNTQHIRGLPLSSSDLEFLRQLLAGDSADV